MKSNEEKKPSKVAISENVIKNEKMTRSTIDIPVSLHMKLKIASATHRKTMAKIICEILTRGIDKY